MTSHLWTAIFIVYTVGVIVLVGAAAVSHA